MDSHFVAAAGISTMGSELLDSNGQPIASNIIDGHTYHKGTNVEAFAWDAINYQDALYVLFRDPTSEPDMPKVSLMVPDYSVDASGFTYDAGGDHFLTSEMADWWLATYGDAPMPSHLPLAATYEIPDMADYRQRTKCYQRITPERQGEPRAPDVTCNNLLKSQFYQQSVDAPQQMLLLYPDTQYKLRLKLVDMPF